jgi:2-amino-4-hydroxy-6-hydroxymethyldihydropteridine diphosphokinase
VTVERAALGLGSNLGDRIGRIREACLSISGEDGVTVAAVSSVFETTPVGGPEQPDYLNAVVVVDTTLTAAQLLALAHRLEDRAGRRRTTRWGARTLDVDVLAVGTQRLDQPQLVVPHPRAHERAFVLVPWAEVDPDFEVPGRGRVADLLTAVDTAGVTRWSERVVGPT